MRWASRYHWNNERGKWNSKKRGFSRGKFKIACIYRVNGLYRSRTDTPLRAMDFESIASANSAKRPYHRFSRESCFSRLFQRSGLYRISSFVSTDQATPVPGSILRKRSAQHCKPAPTIHPITVDGLSRFLTVGRCFCTVRFAASDFVGNHHQMGDQYHRLLVKFCCCPHQISRRERADYSREVVSRRSGFAHIATERYVSYLTLDQQSGRGRNFPKIAWFLAPPDERRPNLAHRTTPQA
jgi:hypothetical protein